MKKINKKLFLSDCLKLLSNWYEKGITNFINLIYIDPPFNSNRNYNIIFKGSEATEHAFIDTWSEISYLDELENISYINPNLYNFLKLLENSGMPTSFISYLTKMSIRCWYMREMLTEDGSFYYHCDQTTGHYIKIMMDYIFGIENFKNEIIWKRDSAGKGGKKNSKQFSRNIDIILFYTKNKEYYFNQPYSKNLSFTQLKEFHYIEEESKRKFKIVTLGNYTDESIEKLRQENKIYKTKSGKEYKKYYLDEFKLAIGSVWNDIPNLSHGRNKENLGYPTQKPENLLKRIIESSSKENDYIADFFIGGGTTISVAEKLNRNWIGCDINYRAIQITKERLEKLNLTLKKDFVIYGMPNSAKELRKMVDENILGPDKNSKFAFEDIIIKYYLKGVIGNKVKIGDNSIDGRFSFKYNGKIRNGFVQVTTGANINHFKAFCSMIGKGDGDLGVYITFSDKISNGMIKEAKSYGRIGHVDKIQILTVEDLIDNNKQYEVPTDILTFN